ncbi:hypothetical protein [Bacillus cereus group sp. BfR-BA-01392]
MNGSDGNNRVNGSDGSNRYKYHGDVCICK